MPLSPSNSSRTPKQLRAVTVVAFLREDAGKVIEPCRLDGDYGFLQSETAFQHDRSPALLSDGPAVAEFNPRSTISAADVESTPAIHSTQQVQLNSVFEGKFA